MRVVYHTAAMGNWQEVVTEQLALLKSVDLPMVDCTHVGYGLTWLLDEAKRQGVTLNICDHSTHLEQYEKAAIRRVQSLAMRSNEPILYLHTKGVSAPDVENKRKWRLLMQEHVVKNWEQHAGALSEFDAVGVNWIDSKRTPHFSGNFWVARPSWLRKLPDFDQYHKKFRRRIRYERCTCEFWIGSNPRCKVKSLVCRNEEFWKNAYDFDKWFDPCDPMLQ